MQKKVKELGLSLRKISDMDSQKRHFTFWRGVLNGGITSAPALEELKRIFAEREKELKKLSEDE